MLMEQKIFELGLSVEVVSVYLLCVGLAESDTELTFENMTAVWSDSEANLFKGIDELEKRHIIEKDDENKKINQIFNSALWKTL